MTKRVKVGDYVKCNGPCARTLHYTSLNFYIGKSGHKCKACTAIRNTILKREARKRAELGIPSYKDQLKALNKAQ